MIVTIVTHPKVEMRELGEYSRMVECDTIHKTRKRDSVILLLYRNGKLVENNEFTEKTRVFIMEQGKTVDRIDFKVNN